MENKKENKRLISEEEFLELLIEHNKYLEDSSKGNRLFLIDTVLRNLEFDQANLSFNNSVFINCVFVNCSFYKSEFMHSSFSFCVIKDCKFTYCDFSNSSMSELDMNDCDLHNSNFYGCSMRGLIQNCDLHRTTYDIANLSYLNIIQCDLRFSNFLNCCSMNMTNLKGTNLDFSSLPLSCLSLHTQFDDKQIIQIVYHAVKAGLSSYNVSEEVKDELAKLIDLANKFHRISETGIINYSKPQIYEIETNVKE